MIGIPTDKPCIVCGEINSNIIEMTTYFDYAVCKDHYAVPVDEIYKLVKRRLDND